jgi:hypothetical protein
LRDEAGKYCPQGGFSEKIAGVRPHVDIVPVAMARHGQLEDSGSYVDPKESWGVKTSASDEHRDVPLA